MNWDSLNDRHVDAYLIWAELTGFEGCRPRDAMPVADAPEEIVVALELDPKVALQPLAGLRLHKIAETNGSTFATARLPLAEWAALLTDPAVKRMEVGTVEPALSPVDPRPAPSVPTRLEGPVIAVIDFGCAFAHERFRGSVGDKWRTRIAYLWDQDSRRLPVGPTWRPVHGFGYGRELVAAQIDRLLGAGEVDEDRVYREADYPDVARMLAHGTHVLDLAAGADPEAQAEASLPQIIFVQLPSFAVDDTSGGSMVPYLMDALGYIRERVDPGARVVVNLSYGSMAGPHDGSTLCETVMDAVIGQSGRRQPSGYLLDIVLPAGNSFRSEGHARVRLDQAQPSVVLPWLVLADDPTDTFLEVWYARDAAGAVEVVLTAPDGRQLTAAVDKIGVLRDGVECVAALIHRRRVAGGLNDAMALLALAPTASDGSRPSAPSGIWTVGLSLTGARDKANAIEVFLWIERDDPSLGSLRGPRQSRFLTDRTQAIPSPATRSATHFPQTMNGNSLANGELTTVVGGYVQAELVRAAYSSAGPTRNARRVIWPSRRAPTDSSSVLRGLPAAGTRSGMVVRMDGTSVAAPTIARRLITP